MVITTITASRLMLGGFALLVIEPGIKSTVRQKMDQLRRYQLNNLNSDELRRQLDENNESMNTLADDNQRIVELLAQRGLKAIEKAAGEDLVCSADKMIIYNAGGTEVFNTDWPNPLANPGLRANSKVKSPFSEEHSKAVNQPIPEELSAMMSSFFKGFGHVRVGNTGGEVLIDTEWPNPLVNPDQYEAHRRMAEWVGTFQEVKEDRMPLTTEELKAGGWWCEDVSEECAAAFKSKSINVYNSGEWAESFEWTGCRFVDSKVSRSPEKLPSEKQIHRIGNHFYWGAAK